MYNDESIFFVGFETKSIMHIQNEENYGSHLSGRINHLIDVREHESHLCGTAMDSQDLRESINCWISLPFLSKYTENMNGISDVLIHQRSETLFRSRRKEKSEKRSVLSPNVYIVSLEQIMPQKFTNSGALVFNFALGLSRLQMSTCRKQSTETASAVAWMANPSLSSNHNSERFFVLQFISRE